VHHIVPWEICKSHDFPNLIALCPNCHRRADAEEIDRKSLRMYKARLSAATGHSLEEATVEKWRVEKLSETRGGSPGYEFEFEFPLFSSPEFQDISFVLRAWGIELMHAHRSRIYLEKPLDGFENAPPDWTSASFHISRFDDALIGIQYQVHWYGSGAAHPNSHSRAFNYLAKPVVLIGLKNIFNDPTKGLEWVSEYCIRELLRARDGEDVKKWVSSGASPKPKNYSSITFDKAGLVVTFDAYQVDCYAAGPQIVSIPYVQASSILNSTVPWQ